LKFIYLCLTVEPPGLGAAALPAPSPLPVDVALGEIAILIELERLI
jgi:hypothetical protein